MSARREVWEVGRREFIQRWRTRAMRVSFVLMILISAGSAVAAALSEDRTPTDRYGLVGARAQTVAGALRAVARADGRRAVVVRLPSRAAAADAVRNGRADVAIAGDGLIVKDSAASAAARIAQRATAAVATVAHLTDRGLTRAQAIAVLTPRALRVDVLEPSTRDVARERGVLTVGALILLGTLLLYGQAVAQSVTEEKSSRVIEILLTSVSPRRLLAGKVLGVGALAVVQLVVICAAALIAGNIAGGGGLPRHTGGTIALVIAWFVLGFAFFSVAYAALGALVSRQEDLEASMAPVNVVIICSYVGALAAIDDPNGTWAHIAAFLPPFAPLVVPARVVIGDMGAAGLLASVTIELVAAVLLVRAAARIYERSILQIGAPISLTSALHAGREPRLPVPRRLLQLPGRARHHPQGQRRDGDAAPRSPARAGGAAAEPPLRRGRVGWKGGPHR